MNETEAAGVDFGKIALGKLPVQHADCALGEDAIVGRNPALADMRANIYPSDHQHDNQDDGPPGRAVETTLVAAPWGAGGFVNSHAHLGRRSLRFARMDHVSFHFLDHLPSRAARCNRASFALLIQLRRGRWRGVFSSLRS